MKLKLLGLSVMLAVGSANAAIVTTSTAPTAATVNIDLGNTSRSGLRDNFGNIANQLNIAAGAAGATTFVNHSLWQADMGQLFYMLDAKTTTAGANGSSTATFDGTNWQFTFVDVNNAAPTVVDKYTDAQIGIQAATTGTNFASQLSATTTAISGKMTGYATAYNGLYGSVNSANVATDTNVVASKLELNNLANATKQGVLLARSFNFCKASTYSGGTVTTTDIAGCSSSNGIALTRATWAITGTTGAVPNGTAVGSEGGATSLTNVTTSVGTRNFANYTDYVKGVYSNVTTTYSSVVGGLGNWAAFSTISLNMYTAGTRVTMSDGGTGMQVSNFATGQVYYIATDGTGSAGTNTHFNKVGIYTSSTILPANEVTPAALANQNASVAALTTSVTYNGVTANYLQQMVNWAGAGK